MEPLIEALKKEESGIRFSAAMALGKLNDSRAVEPLIEALKNEKSSFLRKNITEALNNIQSQ